MISAEQASTRFHLQSTTHGFGSWQRGSHLKESVVLLHEGDLHLPHDLVLDWEGPHNMGDFANAVVRQNQLDWEQGKSLHTFIVDGGLTVDGAVLNASGNGGALLLVTGSLKARSVVGGGSEIRIRGHAWLGEAAFGHYNDGALAFEGGLTVPIYLNDDHDMWVEGEKNIEFDFSAFRSGVAEEANPHGDEEEEEDQNGDAPLPVSLLARLDPDIGDKAGLCDCLLEGKPVFISADGRSVVPTPTQWLQRVRQRWQRLAQMPAALVSDGHVDAALSQSGLAMRHVPASMQTEERIHAALIHAPEAYWVLCDAQRNDAHAAFAIRHGLDIGRFPTEGITLPMCEAAIAADPRHQAAIPAHLVSPGIVMALVMQRRHPSSFPAHWDKEKVRAELPAHLGDPDAVPLDRLKTIALRLPQFFKTPEVLSVLQRRLGEP